MINYQFYDKNIRKEGERNKWKEKRVRDNDGMVALVGSTASSILDDSLGVSVFELGQRNNRGIIEE